MTSKRLIATATLVFLIGPFVLTARPADRVTARTPNASYFLSPQGSDRGRCTRRAPCRTLDRAYHLAKRGEVIELAAGSYPSQEISGKRTGARGKGRAVFRPASRARVEVNRLSILPGVANAEFVRLDFPEGWAAGEGDTGSPARNIVFRRTSGRLFAIENVARLSVLGGVYGPSVDAPSQIKVYNVGNTYRPTDVLIDGVLFRDFTRSGSDVHTECLQVYAGLRITIRNSRFTNCDGTGALALTSFAKTSLRGVLVENNWFDERGDAFYAIQADQSVKEIVFRYNSATKSLVFNDCDKQDCGSARVVGNYMPWSHALCARSVTFSRNVFQGGRCSSTDYRVGRLNFVDAVGFDLHLRRGSAAVCRGDWKELPRRDIDGQVRPRKYRPDAGADQLPKTTSRKGLPRRCRLKRR